MLIFRRSPGLGACVHKLWINGYHSAETVSMILDTVGHCPNLDHLTIPWTTLRYGCWENWSRLLGSARERRKALSLEFLAVRLSKKESIEWNAQHHELHSSLTSLDFSPIQRLKIFGETNIMPIVDQVWSTSLLASYFVSFPGMYVCRILYTSI